MIDTTKRGSKTSNTYENEMKGMYFSRRVFPKQRVTPEDKKTEYTVAKKHAQEELHGFMKTLYKINQKRKKEGLDEFPELKEEDKSVLIKSTVMKCAYAMNSKNKLIYSVLWANPARKKKMIEESINEVPITGASNSYYATDEYINDRKKETEIAYDQMSLHFNC